MLHCWNTEGIFRLIQSIPSPKAEPFKRWLARVGYERVQEIEDPELATKRTRAIYQAKGYSADWIEKRMRSIAIRDRGGGHPACRRGRASCRPEKAPAVRRLKNLRMTPESVCASSAGLEARLYGRQDARHYTGNARRELEKKSGRKVVTNENYLALTQAAKKAKRIK
jgi:hypothetical protein